MVEAPERIWVDIDGFSHSVDYSEVRPCFEYIRADLARTEASAAVKVDVSEILLPLEDIHSDAGQCEWADVANAIDEVRRRIFSALSPAPQEAVPCECTKIEQDETCPVGHPSLLCDVCDGKGIVTAPQEAEAEEPDFAKSIAAVIEEECANGAAVGWRSCSGCHETNEGYETGYFPYSKLFGCHVGSGCSECGGLGVVWEYWSAEAIDAMVKDDAEPALSPAPQEAEALEAGGVVWFGYNNATGEFTGEYCTVEPHNSHGFLPYVRAAHPPAPAVTEDMIEAASHAYNEIFRSFGSHEAAIKAALQSAQEVKLEEHWREIKQDSQPRIADGYTAVSISKPGYWFVKGPGPAALQASQEVKP